MNLPDIDHDQLFKELLTTFFVEFVELFFPDLSAILERDGLEFLDKEMFSDLTVGDRYETDLIVKARFRAAPDAPAGTASDAYFLVHIENQAKPQAQFARRMFRYFTLLHGKFDLPVYPIALFSYDRPLRPEPDRFEVAFPGFVVNTFRFRTIQLNRLDWRSFLQQSNPVASALMAKMRIAPADRPKVKSECLRLLATLQLNPAKARLISGFVDSYLRLNAQEQQQFEQEVAIFAPPEQETMMELTTSWKEEGILLGLERGKREGLERGRQEGEQQLVARQLRRKVGELTSEMQERIAALPAEKLEVLAEALLDFAQPDDLTNWLDANAI